MFGRGLRTTKGDDRLHGYGTRIISKIAEKYNGADVVYLPKRRSALPALVVELKWNKSSEGAIRQVKERNYPAVLKDYGGEIVLVGIVSFFIASIMEFTSFFPIPCF